MTPRKRIASSLGSFIPSRGQGGGRPVFSPDSATRASPLLDEARLPRASKDEVLREVCGVDASQAKADGAAGASSAGKPTLGLALAASFDLVAFLGAGRSSGWRQGDPDSDPEPVPPGPKPVKRRRTFTRQQTCP